MKKKSVKWQVKVISNRANVLMLNEFLSAARRRRASVNSLVIVAVWFVINVQLCIRIIPRKKKTTWQADYVKWLKENECELFLMTRLDRLEARKRVIFFFVFCVEGDNRSLAFVIRLWLTNSNSGEFWVVTWGRENEVKSELIRRPRFYSVCDDSPTTDIMQIY